MNYVLRDIAALISMVAFVASVGFWTGALSGAL